MLTARNGLIAAVLLGLGAAGLHAIQNPEEPQRPPVATERMIGALEDIAAAIRESRQLPATAQVQRGYTGCIVEVSDVLATVAGRSSCPPCNYWADDVRTVAAPNGWRVGSTDRDHFKMVETAGPWPVFRFMEDGKEFHRIVGYERGKTLAEIWNHHPLVKRN